MSNRAYAEHGERWIVRRDARYRARYYQGPYVPDGFTWGRWQRGAWRMTLDAATRKAEAIGGRVVRLLSRAESVHRAEVRGYSRGYALGLADGRRGR